MAPRSLPEALPEASRTGARFSKHFRNHFGSIFGPPGARKSSSRLHAVRFFRKTRGSKKKSFWAPKATPPLAQNLPREKRKAESGKTFVSTLRQLVSCACGGPALVQAVFRYVRWPRGGASCFPVRAVTPPWCKLFTGTCGDPAEVQAVFRCLRWLDDGCSSASLPPCLAALLPCSLRCLAVFLGASRSHRVAWRSFRNP